MTVVSGIDSGLKDPGLYRKTVVFFLEFVISELKTEIDFRARGHGRNVLVRIALYLGSLARDLFRIPTHYERGIAQAQFRFREAYLEKRVIPTLLFFRDNYPLEAHHLRLLEESVLILQQALNLTHDGKLPKLDAWYATMEEFFALTQSCQAAAAKLEEFVSSLDGQMSKVPR